MEMTIFSINATDSEKVNRTVAFCLVTFNATSRNWFDVSPTPPVVPEPYPLSTVTVHVGVLAVTSYTHDEM